jgi:hypothetical protein
LLSCVFFAVACGSLITDIKPSSANLKFLRIFARISF